MNVIKGTSYIDIAKGLGISRGSIEYMEPAFINYAKDYKYKKNHYESGSSLYLSSKKSVSSTLAC